MVLRERKMSLMIFLLREKTVMLTKPLKRKMTRVGAARETGNCARRFTSTVKKKSEQ